MGRLGYERYGAQGGDWGAAVTTQIGRNGGRCAAIHVNMPLARPTGSLENPTEDEKRALERVGYYRQWDTGYAKEQSTRPQTIGYGLTDSPVGQLAWIVEKFWSWMDCDGHPENVLTRDELLDNVMLYWATASAASSARLYWESFRDLRRGRAETRRVAHRCRLLPEGDPPGAAQLVRGRLQHHPFHEDAARRALRGVRAARAVRRRRPRPSSLPCASVEHDRGRLPRGRCGRDGARVHRHPGQRVRRHRRGGGSQRPAWRPLDDRVSVRAAASAVGVLRRELAKPGQRRHRPGRPRTRATTNWRAAPRCAPTSTR